MKWKTLIITIAILTSILSFKSQVFAVECTDNPPSEGISDDEKRTYWEQVSTACDQLKATEKQKGDNLESELKRITYQINITKSQINQTVIQIKQLEEEISTLTEVIGGLSDSQHQLDGVYKAKVREFYKNRQPSTISLFLASDNFASFFTNIKYLQTVRLRDKLVLQEIEKYRLNYNQRKEAKENKQQEVETLQIRLTSKKKELGDQEALQKQILIQTRNQEKVYQQLSQAAKQQATAFKRFTTSQGGSSILSGQTKCTDWGCYYNQRDSEWGSQLIGNSSETMKEVGCLITSMAMIASHYGKSIKPSDIAANSSWFWLNTAYLLQGALNINGVNMTRTSVGSSTSRIDEEISAGRPVIVGLFAGPDHFIVIKGKNDQGYIMNDPFLENGSDKPFLDKYQISNISRVDRVSVN